jgi:hypothetical protein
MALVTEGLELVTVSTFSGIRPGFDAMDKPKIPVVNPQGRKISPLMAIFAEPGAVTGVAGIRIRLCEYRVFYRPVKVMISRGDIAHIDMAGVTTVRCDTTRLRIKMTKMTCFFTRHKRFARNFGPFLFFFRLNYKPDRMTCFTVKSLFAQHLLMRFVRKLLLRCNGLVLIPPPLDVPLLLPATIESY